MAIHDITTRLLAVADQDAHISRASMKISLPKLLLHERKAQAAEHTKMPNIRALLKHDLVRRETTTVLRGRAVKQVSCRVNGVTPHLWTQASIKQQCTRQLLQPAILGFDQAISPANIGLTLDLLDATIEAELRKRTSKLRPPVGQAFIRRANLSTELTKAVNCMTLATNRFDNSIPRLGINKDTHILAASKTRKLVGTMQVNRHLT
jgi:hypothetical protein